LDAVFVMSGSNVKLAQCDNECWSIIAGLKRFEGVPIRPDIEGVNDLEGISRPRFMGEGLCDGKFGIWSVSGLGTSLDD
jgi:hypothetical protein